MICDRCGHINPNINKTCNKCGTPLERKTDQEKRKQGIVERKSHQDTGLFSSISNLSSGKKIFILGAILLLVVLAVASVTPDNDNHPLFAENNSTGYTSDINNTPTIRTDNYTEENTTETQRIDSKISVNATSPVKSNQSTIITGYLTDKSNKALAYEEIKIKIANNEYTVQSKYDGSYSLEFNDTDNGSQSVTVTYDGNENISSCYNSTFFEVIKEENSTNNTQNQSNNTTGNNNTKNNETNNTTDHNNTHNNSSTHTNNNNTSHNDTKEHNNTTSQNKTTPYNNTTDNTTEDKNITPNNNTTQDNQTEHNDSTEANPSKNDSQQNDNNTINNTINNTNKTEREKIDSKLSVDVNNNHQDEKTNISGILTDKDNHPISNAQIIIKIGNNTYTTHTDSQGKYSIDYSPTGNESDEIIVMYEGDDKYLDSHETTRF